MKKITPLLLIAGFLSFTHCAQAQKKEIKSAADLPVINYSMATLNVNDSSVVNNWMKNTAWQEVKHIDSILENFIITDPDINRQLLETKVYCYFILSNWDSTLTGIDRYRAVALIPPEAKNIICGEIFPYAKSKQLPGNDFAKNYVTFFNDEFTWMGEDDRESQPVWFISQYLEPGANSINDKLKKAVADGIASGSGLNDLLLTYTDAAIAKEATVPLKELNLKTEAENFSTIDTHVRIPLKNGLKLSGILILPKKFELPLPTVLRVTCYPTQGNENEISRAKQIAKKGYASLVVFPRGKNESEGIFYPFENDADDNYDIIDWISKQSWCNGRVGMIGGSYGGFTTWAATKKMHPALKTIVPQVAVAPGSDKPQDGIWRTFDLQWIKRVRNGKYNDYDDFSNEKKWSNIKEQYITKGIAFNRLDSLEGNGMDTVFQRWLQHTVLDNYWDSMTPYKDEYAKINIPVLTMTGYFDGEQRGAMYYYAMHNKYGTKDGAKNHYLFIGPYTHGGTQGYASSSLPPYEIDAAALIDKDEMIMQWFDYTLRNGKQPDFLKDRVSVFALGENKWHYFNSVSNMNKDTMQYFLSASPEIEDKNLLLTQNKTLLKQDAVQLDFDTRNVENDTLHIYDGDNQITENIFKKKDKLVFKSAVLGRDIILNGTITADLYASLSSPDTDLLLSWWEEDAEGKLWPLSETVQRLSYSFDKRKRVLWKKDKVYHINLNNGWWMCKQVKKGSKLVMTVSPLSDTDWQKNYGSGKEVSTETIKDGRPVVFKIYTGNKFSSHINIPAMR